MKTINEILYFSDEQIDNLGDDEILKLSYAIKYFDFYGMTITERTIQTMDKLRNRLKGLNEPKINKLYEPLDYVMCDCGHEVLQSLKMCASLGTSCPDCYDKMSI